MVLEHHGHELKVRVSGIDSPELQQAFGRQARSFLVRLTEGRQVAVHTTDRDDYGRTVAELQLADGRSVGAELVKAGMAWYLDHYFEDRSLERLQDQARAARRGLWSGSSRTPPWRWRQER